MSGAPSSGPDEPPTDVMAPPSVDPDELGRRVGDGSGDCTSSATGSLGVADETEGLLERRPDAAPAP